MHRFRFFEKSLKAGCMMRIEAFSFGNITIEGTTYTTDVIVYPDHVESN